MFRAERRGSSYALLCVAVPHRADVAVCHIDDNGVGTMYIGEAHEYESVPDAPETRDVWEAWLRDDLFARYRLDFYRFVDECGRMDGGTWTASKIADVLYAAGLRAATHLWLRYGDTDKVFHYDTTRVVWCRDLRTDLRRRNYRARAFAIGLRLPRELTELIWHEYVAPIVRPCSCPSFYDFP
jgi:hypothetical protein